MANTRFPRDLQYAKFSAYGFLKNLRFFEPFMVLFLLEQGVSYFEVGMLYAVREVGVNLLEIPTGAVADGIGRRRAMIISFGSYILSFLLFWFGCSLRLFLLAMLLFSAGEAFRSGTHKAMIFAHIRVQGIEDQSNDYYGHTRGWAQTGSAISALLAAGIVFVAGGFRWVFLFSIIPYLLDLLLILSYPRELDGDRGSINSKEIRKRLRELAIGLRETVRHAGARRSVLSAALYPGYFKGAKDYLQPIVAALALSLPVAKGISEQQREALLIGVVYTGIFLFSAFASRHSASLSGRLKTPERAMNWELAIGLGLGAAIGISKWLGTALLPVILFFALYFIHNTRKPVAVTTVARKVPEELLATVLSVESQLETLFAALAALVVGAVAELVGGNVGPGLALVAVLGILLLPVVWIAPAKQRGEEL